MVMLNDSAELLCKQNEYILHENRYEWEDNY